MTAVDTWDPCRLQKLEQFALAHRGKKFNMRGMRRVPDKRLQHSDQGDG